MIFFTTSLSAEKVERLGFYNIQELLEDDNLTYKIIKSCVSLNSAITEITREDHPDLAKNFFDENQVIILDVDKKSIFILIKVS